MVSRDDRRRGTTLLETSMSATLLVGVVGTALSLTRESQGVVLDCMRALVDRSESNDALAELAAALSQSNGATLQIDSRPVDGDRLLLQLPLEFAGAATTWGAAGQRQGTTASLAGEFEEYRLVASERAPGKFRLVRRAVDADGAALSAEREVADGIDGADSQGEKGFAVLRDESLVRITLRVGHAVEATVRLRNP